MTYRLLAALAFAPALSLVGCSSAHAPDDEPVAQAASALSYQTTQEIVAGDSTASALWGNAVVAHAGVLAVTDTIENAIYVYERQGAQWTRTGKLAPPADDATTLELASAVAVTATNVFAKHCTTGDFSLGRRCHVDVFARSGAGTWAYQERVAGDASAYEKFGMALAADGDVLVAGASLDQAGGIGSAYVFTKSGGAFARVQKLVPASAGRTLDAYGQTLALSGTTLLVGSLAESNASGDEGAIYQYSAAGNQWNLGARLVVPAGDGQSLGIAGDVLVASGGLTPAVDILRHGSDGYTLEAPLAAANAHNIVACDGPRVGVAAGDGNLRLYSPSGSSWNMNDLPLGTGSGRAIAMSDGAIFAGIAGSPPKVRILTYGQLDGDTCTGSAGCASGFCVDGVCCESACGGGSATDCQACSRAAGSTADGKCLPVASSYVCRAANGVCDVADRCDGSGKMCPADLVAPNGSPCAGTGTCNAGACSVTADGTPPPAAVTPPATATDASSGGCTSAGSGAGSAWLPALAFALVAARRRKKRTAGSSIVAK